MSSSRTVGLLVLALLILSPSAALAEAGKFVGDEYPVTIESDQANDLEFLFAVGNLECEEIELSGELLEPSETLALEPSFSECFLGGVEATAETEGCAFVIHAGEEGELEGKMDLVCEGENELVFDSPVCEVRVGPQSGLEAVAYENHLEEEPSTFTASFEVTNLAYSLVNDILCVSSEHEDGQLFGSVPIEGVAEGEAQARGVAVGPLPAVLCKAVPNANGVCPKGEGYEGKVTGTASGVAKFTKNAAEFVSCEKATLEGQYDKAARGKLETLTVEGGAEKSCTTTLPNEPKVQITFTGLPYAPSWFEYKVVPAPNQGVMWWGVRPGIKFEMLIEAVACKYVLGPAPTFGLISNAGAGATTGTFSAQFVRETINAKCPVALAFSLAMVLTRGKEDVNIAREVAK